MEKRTAKTKKAIDDLSKFRKKHEPRLERLSNYIDSEGDKLFKKNKDLR